MLISAFVVIRGVSNGIERVSRVLMPLLFIFLLVIMLRGVTLSGSREGVSFLLNFDSGSVTVMTVLTALGQAFFSLSLGMGVMCTYGSYLKKSDNLARSTLCICAFDTIIALISAFAIIPAAFSAGIPLGQGGTFAFVALPEIFGAMPFGAVFGTMFYILLFFAALTSSISIIEGIVAYVSEERNVSRTTAALGSSVLMFALGCLYSLSMGAVKLRGVWFSFRDGFYVTSFGETLELIPDIILMPLGSLAFAIFVGWIWGADNAVSEIRQNGRFAFRLAALWSFCLKFVVPAAITTIFVMGLSGYGG